MTGGLYLLYGSQPSLCTGRTRSYFRKKKLPFDERLR
jgi:hypothetical protein